MVRIICFTCDLCVDCGLARWHSQTEAIICCTTKKDGKSKGNVAWHPPLPSTHHQSRRIGWGLEGIGDKGQRWLLQPRVKGTAPPPLLAPHRLPLIQRKLRALSAVAATPTWPNKFIHTTSDLFFDWYLRNCQHWWLIEGLWPPFLLHRLRRTSAFCQAQQKSTYNYWVGGIGFIGRERGEDENRRKRIRMRIRMWGRSTVSWEILIWIMRNAK